MNTSVMKGAALMSMLALSYPGASKAGVSVGISVGFAPPVIPVYVQPPCPVVGYIWTPGYWAWSADDQDYYWVPGAWVAPPSFGLLWTPGYWGFSDGAYLWHTGYWGPHVGFYGGINYGFGYFGSGFEGGYWRGHDFFYNRSVTNVSNVSVTNVYNHTVVNNFNSSHASFNGPNGVQARPTHQDMLAARDPHRGFTGAQQHLIDTARHEPGALAAQNHGHPSMPAARAGEMGRRGVEPVRPGTAATRGVSSATHNAAAHPVERPPSLASTHAPGHAPAPHASPQHSYPTQHLQQPSQANAPAHFQPSHPANVSAHPVQASRSVPASAHANLSRPAAPTRREPVSRPASPPQHVNMPRPAAAPPHAQAPQRLEAHSQPGRAPERSETHRRS